MNIYILFFAISICLAMSHIVANRMLAYQRTLLVCYGIALSCLLAVSCFYSFPIVYLQLFMLPFFPLLYYVGTFDLEGLHLRGKESQTHRAVLYVILFLIPIIASFLTFRYCSWQTTNVAIQDAKSMTWPIILVIAILSAFNEEVLFRQFWLGFVCRMTKKMQQTSRLILMVAVTTLFFTVLHHGYIEPFWLKWIQAFILGTVLCVIRLIYGLSAAIAAHIGFNLSMILFPYFSGN